MKAGGEASRFAPLAAFPLAVVLSLVAVSAAFDRPSVGSHDVEEAATPFAADEALAQFQVQRARETARYASRFGISRELAADIYDAARTEGIDPDLAFRLVKIESSFRQRAVGPMGSIGYTQVQPATARWLDSTMTRERLFERETNLRIGFRYLRMLLDRYDSDTRLALLAYNRGPGTVAALLAVGQDPGNGYARRVLGGSSFRTAADD